jgi:putative component of membrane protein insertase Oxa1/YidC/SpoIIIJ protein YidD
VHLSQDISFLKEQLEESPVKISYTIEKSETNEIKMGVQLFFLFYKNFLSSQDNRNCSFSPSCSTYCLHSIRKKGVLLGLMGAFDRLSRCNGLSPENYQIDFSTRQLLDPVE